MPPASWTRSAIALTMTGPNVIGGTKWPSMTSTWMTRAPAASTSSTWAARRAKSADRIDGATRRSASSPFVCLREMASDLLKHAAVAVVAFGNRRCRHADDRRVLAAVGAHRHQLKAPQAVDAAVAPGHCRRPQPRLTAAGTLRAELGR